MNSNVAVQFSTSSSTIVDPVWVRLEQVVNSDLPTVKEIAELLDATFQTSACDGSDEPDEPIDPAIDPNGAQTLQDRKKERFDEAVKNIFDFDICNAIEGQWEAEVKVWRSNIHIDYYTRLTGGVIISTKIVNEQITENIVIDQKDRITLDKPIISSGTFSWNGAAVTGFDTSTIKPITAKGNTLSWGTRAAGSIKATYNTQYDLLKIRVDAKPGGEMGECQVLCFYSGLVEQKDLEQPEVSEEDERLNREEFCKGRSQGGGTGPSNSRVPWVVTDTEYRCNCTNDKAYTISTPEDPPIAERYKYIYPAQHKDVFGGYVDCGLGDDTDIADPIFYEQKCCFPPNRPLPNCEYTYFKNPGGVPVDPDAAGEIAERYAPLVVDFIPVLPESGDCGITTHQWIMHQLACCEFVEPLVWDSENSVSVIADNSYGAIVVTGGKLPLTVSVRGSGFWLNGARSIRDGIVDGRNIRIYTSDACGSATVTITDGCSSVSGVVSSLNGEWQPIPLSELPPGNYLSDDAWHGGDYYTSTVNNYRVTQWWVNLGTSGGGIGLSDPCFTGLNSGGDCDSMYMIEAARCKGWFSEAAVEEYVHPKNLGPEIVRGVYCVGASSPYSDDYLWVYIAAAKVASIATAGKWVC